MSSGTDGQGKTGDDHFSYYPGGEVKFLGHGQEPEIPRLGSEKGEMTMPTEETVGQVCGRRIPRPREKADVKLSGRQEERGDLSQEEKHLKMGKEYQAKKTSKRICEKGNGVRYSWRGLVKLCT